MSILRAVGVPSKDAVLVAESIVYAHTRGKHTHGIGRLSIYVRKIKEGLMNSETHMTKICDMGAVSVFDAGNGFGQVAAIMAMDIAMTKAKSYGVGVVGVRNSNNFGTAGFIGEYSTANKMIGIVLANSAPAIAPMGGYKAILGTNPICIAFPSENREPPIVFDMACSSVARGKIRLAAKNGERIPYGWAVDSSGNDTDDPNEALHGAMLPIGSYKGFGLALCVDILAGLLTGSGFGGNVKNLNHPSDISRNGHFIIAIDPNCFLPYHEFTNGLSQIRANIHDCGKDGNVFLPGERSYRESELTHEYVNVSDSLVSDVNALIKRLNINDLCLQ